MLHTAANPGDPAWDRAWKFFGSNTNGVQAVVRLDPSKRTQKQKDLIVNDLIARFNEGFEKERLAAEKIDELRKKLQEPDAETPRVSKAPTVAEFGEPRKTNILMRGDFRNKGMEVEKVVPAFLPALDGPDRSRLALVRWLLSRDKPLTASATYRQSSNGRPELQERHPATHSCPGKARCDCQRISFAMLLWRSVDY